MQGNVEIRQSQASPTFICWLLLNITSWSQGPSVTYGLCMLSEFPAITERTNAEFSISARRWGSRFAFFFTGCIWGASQQNPLPRSHTQQLVISRVWPQIFKILLFFLSYIRHRHRQPRRNVNVLKMHLFLSFSFSLSSTGLLGGRQMLLSPGCQTAAPPSVCLMARSPPDPPQLIYITHL